MRSYLLVMLTAAAIAFLATPISLRLSKKLGAVTKIRDRDMHTEPTPRFGGTAIFVGILGTLLVASKMHFLQAIFQLGTPVWYILLGAAVVTLLGALDDVYDLNWVIKLLGQFIAAGIVSAGLSLTMVPFGHIAISNQFVGFFLSTLFIVITMNAINFVDGLDGLAAGIAVIGGAAFFIASYYVTRSVNENDYSNLATLVMAALVGGCVGFLPHNFRPAKIFMGDSGAMLIGLLLSSGAIAAAGQIDGGFYNRAGGLPAFMPIILPIAVICLPLVDLAMTVIRRTARGTSPFSADRGHMHHKLVDGGYSHVQAVVVMYIWAIVISFGTVAFAFFPWQIVLTIDILLIALTVIVTFAPWIIKNVSNPKHKNK